jgi:hypothetical protein
MPHLPHQRDRLQPAEALLDSLSLFLAEGLSLMRPRRFPEEHLNDSDARMYQRHKHHHHIAHPWMT